jgi:Ca2+-transporting ATPase
MTVTKAYTVDTGVFEIHHPHQPPMLNPEDSRSQLFLIGNLCNHSHSDRGKFHGQATEVALMNSVLAVGLTDQRKVRQLKNPTFCFFSFTFTKG